MVLNSLFDNGRLREHLFRSFSLERHGRSVGDLLLSITEDVIAGAELPVVTAVLLLAGRVVHVSLPVEGITFRVSNGSTGGSDHLLGTFETLGWASKVHIAASSLFGPIIFTGIRLAKWLSDMRGILALFDIIELVRKSRQGLGLDDIADVLGGVGGLSVTVGRREAGRVVGQTVVLLDLARFVHLRFTELLQSVRRRWLIGREVDVLADAVVGILLLTDAGVAETSGGDAWHRVLPYFDGFFGCAAKWDNS